MSREHIQFRVTENDLRSIKPSGPDLLAKAIENDRLTDLIPILTRQIGKYERPNENTYENPPRVRISDRIKAVRILLNNEDLPYEVAQTTTAAIVHDVLDNKLDPNILRFNRFTHTPTAGEVTRWGLSEQDVERAAMEPPILAGSLLLVYYDSIDEHLTWMREIKKGPYQGRWTVRGGLYDNLNEIAAFEEAKEEAGLKDYTDAVPLGTADQIVAVESRRGDIKLLHYLNYMWELRLKYGEKPTNIDPTKPWRCFTDGEVGSLYERGMLAPIAECAFKANRMFL